MANTFADSLDRLNLLEIASLEKASVIKEFQVYIFCHD